MDCIATALSYHARGWQVLPLPAPTKAPKIDGWQDLRLDAAAIRRRFKRDSNIGVLLGEPSGWLVDVDLDHELAVELAAQFLPATGAIFGRAGKPRSHWLFVASAPVETLQLRLDGDRKAMVVELRSTGAQTVFPGSVHPEGERIEWAEAGEPAVVDPHELIDAVHRLHEAVQERLGIGRKPTPTTNGQHVRIDDDRARIIDRAAKYLAKMPPAVDGENGSGATYNAACKLVSGFGLSPREAYPPLAEYSARCVPPWSEKELRHKLDDANAEGGERGYLLRDDRDDVRLASESINRKSADVSTRSPILTCLADVEPRAVSWLWPGRIPSGRITLLVGRPGEGKSFLTADMAARISTGTPWPDGGDCPMGSVILISAEDDPADTIRPRLDAHRADVRNVHLLSAVRRTIDDVQMERIITLADVDAIEAALARVPDCKLLVVDPIGSFLGGGTDAHRDNEVRGVLAPIAALAEKYGPAVLVVAHRRKSAGSIADDLALGSRAFTGIARAVWHLSRDAENKARRLLLPGKNNLAHEGDGLAFSIIDDPPRISWERDPVRMNADEALAAEGSEQKRGPDADALDGAVAWLRSTLERGPRLAKDLMDEWRNGRGGSKRTLERAKQTLDVEAFRPEVPGPWWWRHSKTANTPQEKQLGVLGDLAENAAFLPISGPEKPNTAKFPNLGGLAPTDDEGDCQWSA